jgi:sigma-B regulation protein RsbU (phosphoserine phosphatase)
MALVAVLIVSAGWILMGQIVVYLVNTELEQRMARGSQELSPELLSNLAPNLGDVSVVEFSRGANPDPMFHDLRRHHVPPPANIFDRELTYPAPITFHSKTYYLVVRTRPSAVLGIIFGQKMDWDSFVLLFSFVVASLFLLVLLISVFVGASITRTVTGSVHDLYQGTQRIKEGDFSHRIAVRGADQLAELSQSFNRMTENLERLIVVEKERERLRSELEIAREVQRQLFPKTALSLPAFNLTGVCHPAQVVSGDYYDFVRLEHSAMAMAIGDVAGKGISAALLMASMQAAMRSQLGGPGPVSTAQVVASLNRQVYLSTSPEKYATFYFAVYNTETGVLTYTNAGHLPPILVRGGEARRLEVTGTVVGAFPGAQYEERQIELVCGDLLLAFTDGLTEPENAYGEMFGEERLIEILIKHQKAEPQEIFERTMEAVREWTGTPGLQDDMTMLIARRTAG